MEIHSGGCVLLLTFKKKKFKSVNLATNKSKGKTEATFDRDVYLHSLML